MMRLMLFLAAMGFTFSSFTASATSYGYYSQPDQGNYYGYNPSRNAPVYSQSPKQIVRSGIDLMQTYLAQINGPANKAEIGAFLDSRISPYFDFEYMAQWAAGRGYRQMSAAQKQAFSAKLKQMFFDSLARNLGTYSNPAPRVDIFPARAKTNSNEVTVSARITPASGYPLRLDFRFYRSGHNWKIFDVTANGTSAVVYYRKVFRRMLSRGGF